MTAGSRAHHAGVLGIRHRTNFALCALAAAAFVYVTAETFPVALLPQMSMGLHVGVGAVGRLVTVYAGIGALTAVPLTAWSSHVPRRRLVVAAVAVLALSQLAVAGAPNYAAVLVARGLCALAHGVFWSVLAPIAAALETPERAGRATAIVFTGNSLALALGTPLVSALGTTLGWRAAAAIVAAVASAASVALVVALPPLAGDAPGAYTRERMAAVPAALRNPALMSVCAVTTLVVIGHFSAYTYITRLVEKYAGLTGLKLSVVLLIYGVAGIIGNGLAGWATDSRPRPTAAGVIITFALALVGLGVFGPGSTAWTVLTITAWAAAFGAVPVCMQSGALRVAHLQPSTASAIYVVAFQVGIGGGALAGSVIVDSGLLGSLPFLAAALSMAGLLVLLTARRAFPPGRGRPPLLPSGSTPG
ncbi:MAG: MFS transporter [Acidimicrobiales bacterium]